ncbi:nucleotidyltransferase family protein [Paenibacillus tianjinensis]|uniref:Nucleotidyltransferase family protein n=1 Tax=Paenibacillus tianjinensis TaxID=2810347 RepID=A0ABX7LBC1_9BACL|nr:nucleotidyltransferase family protein [Paenibacillus tianjinensis]QSF45458.1 nucleotidyltransferase family protein [Paenibacillus tianjinensis]
MRIHNEEELLRAVAEDRWMMGILATARSLELPDCWVCAGFVRSKVWDIQHGFTTRTPLGDVDVIYYDPSDIREEVEKALEAWLREADPSVPWSVKNQARMHVVNDLEPYSSATDGMSKFPETATALGLALTGQGEVILSAPHGLSDVLGLIVRPSPLFNAHLRLHRIYEERVAKKNWQSVWNQLQVILPDQSPLHPLSPPARS